MASCRNIQRRAAQEMATLTPHPIIGLSSHLGDIARSMPIHILPGATDPIGAILPQQPFPRAMFGSISSYASFSCETNPTYLRLGPAESSEQLMSVDDAAESTPDSSNLQERTLLIHSGQPMDDIFRYLPSPPATRLSVAESTLRWRHLAPTAPDTLWCHPYLKTEPFIIEETPDIYIIGNQPSFKTKLVVDMNTVENGAEKSGKRCRIVLVPKFKDSGIVALINLRTLEVRTVQVVVGEGLTIPVAEDSQASS